MSPAAPSPKILVIGTGDTKCDELQFMASVIADRTKIRRFVSERVRAAHRPRMRVLGRLSSAAEKQSHPDDLPSLRRQDVHAVHTHEAGRRAVGDVRGAACAADAGSRRAVQDSKEQYAHADRGAIERSASTPTAS